MSLNDMASSPSDDAIYSSEKDDTPLTGAEEVGEPPIITGETPEEREQRLKDLREELEKVESEINMLRQVLGSKVRHAAELKRQLGITPFQEFKSDLQSGLQSIKSSDGYQRTNESLQQFNEKLYSTQAYQKSAAVMKTASEKTTSVFSTMGQAVTKKMGDLKNSNTFKSLDERVHTTYNTVKAKVTGSRSSQDIDEAFREAQVAEAPVSESPATPDDKVPL